MVEKAEKSRKERKTDAMNIMHLKYAVEVAKAGSINKAAEVLLMGQPNLSRAIKELEASLGIAIFDRSAKGMIVTPEGEEFLRYAKKILKQIDEVEAYYKTGTTIKQRFSISVPRASYIAEAFARFSQTIDRKHQSEFFYKETNSSRTINNVLRADYKLGIIRYAENFDKYFKTMLEEKGLNYEMVAEFRYTLLMSEEHPLASKKEIHFSDLRPYIEIAHADPYVPSLSFAEVKKEELPDDIEQRIYIFERASQFELLTTNTETFMWVSPIPDTLLKRYNLVMKECPDNRKLYKDVLIYQKDYKLTELDRAFIFELCQSKRQYL